MAEEIAALGEFMSSQEILPEDSFPRMNIGEGKLFAALSKAQGSIGGIGRDAKNPFFSSTYATLSAVLRVINPILAENELCLTQWVEGSALVSILGHSSGEFISSHYPLNPIRIDKQGNREIRDDPQGIGSAISYARRYAAMAITGCAAEDDDGAAASGTKVGGTGGGGSPAAIQVRPPAGGMTPEVRKMALQKLEALEVDLRTMAGDGIPQAVRAEILGKTGEDKPNAKLTDDQIKKYGKALQAEIQKSTATPDPVQEGE